MKKVTKYQKGGPAKESRSTKVMTKAKSNWQKAQRAMDADDKNPDKTSLTDAYVSKKLNKAAILQEKAIKLKEKETLKGMQKGGSKFPDFTKDGKVTRADILKGRGVLKKGGSVKSKKK